MSSATSYVDLTALMRIRSLELRARLVMEGFWKGMHRSPQHGFSSEFSEYRRSRRGHCGGDRRCERDAITDVIDVDCEDN